jgi:hypothetical protein
VPFLDQDCKTITQEGGAIPVTPKKLFGVGLTCDLHNARGGKTAGDMVFMSTCDSGD